MPGHQPLRFVINDRHPTPERLAQRQNQASNCFCCLVDMALSSYCSLCCNLHLNCVFMCHLNVHDPESIWLHVKLALLEMYVVISGVIRLPWVNPPLVFRERISDCSIARSLLTPDQKVSLLRMTWNPCRNFECTFECFHSIAGPSPAGSETLTSGSCCDQLLQKWVGIQVNIPWSTSVTT